MQYQDYKFTRQYLEAQYATAVQQTQEAKTNYNVALNERDTASKADQPSYDDKVASASQQLDYAKDTERAAANDLTQLQMDPALRDNAKQYEAEKSGQDPVKAWASKHDNDPKEEQPSALHNFAMQAGVVGVIATQALNPSSAQSIQHEMQQDALLAAKVEAQFQTGAQQQSAQDQNAQQQAAQQQGSPPQDSQQQGPQQQGPQQQPVPQQGVQPQGAPQQDAQAQHQGDQKAPEPSNQPAPASQTPPPTEQVTAGPSETELKQQEKEHQKEERSEQAAQNVEQLHHGLEKSEESRDSGKSGVQSGSATFGAPGYPDPERSSAMAASLQSPQGESHQTAPVQGGAEMPPTERPVAAQAKGDAQPGAQAHPDTERSTAAATPSVEAKGQASFGAPTYPNPEREAQMSSAGGKNGPEQTSATYNVTNGAQPREMPPAEPSASQIANTKPEPQQQPDPNHDR